MKLSNLYIFVCIALLSACSSSSNQTEKVNKENQIECAKRFQLIQKEGYKELNVISPQTGKIETSYALVPRAHPVNVASKYTKIEVPVKNMVALSSTFIGMLNEIDALDCLKGTTDLAYVWNKKVRKKIEKGSILAFGFETEVSPEVLLKKKVSLVVFSGFGSAFPNADKLEKLGITCMANYDWEEIHPLGKAEWIKVFGALSGKEDEANAYFDELKKTYATYKKEIKKGKNKPQIMFGDVFGDTWNAPAGQSYMAGVMKDAGVNYVFKNTKGTASVANTKEQMFKVQTDCPIWINAEAKTIKELLTKNSKYSYLIAVKKNQVYSYMNNSSYFWEMSTVHPEWLMEDFAVISGNLSVRKLHFYQRLN